MCLVDLAWQGSHVPGSETRETGLTIVQYILYAYPRLAKPDIPANWYLPKGSKSYATSNLGVTPAKIANFSLFFYEHKMIIEHYYYSY